MAIWSRNKIWGASTFDTDTDVADNNNNASVVPTNGFLGLKFSSEADPRNRSKWFASIIGQLLRATLHKEEDRASKTLVGGNTESTQLSFVTPEQLPVTLIGTNDFAVTTVPGDTVAPTANTLLELVTIPSGTHKQQTVRFSDVGWKWLMEKLKPPVAAIGNQNYYVDGNGGSDITGDGSILKPYATPQYAAYKARTYSFANSNKPVSINVFGGNYIIVDSEVINGITIIGNLWINGGWIFAAGCNITYNSTSENYLFNTSTTALALLPNQVFGNVVIRGALNLTSPNGGCIKQESVSGVNYEINVEGVKSTTDKEFLYINKTNGADLVFTTLKNVTAIISWGGRSCIKALDRPVIEATDCKFIVQSGTTLPNIDFNSAGTDTLGVYCVFTRCSIGSSGVLGQVNIGRNINILDFDSCLFYGSTNTRDNILINTPLTSGQYLRLYRNKTQKRGIGEISIPFSVNNFILANQDATIIAIENDLQNAVLTAASGKTLTIASLHPSTYGALAQTISSATYPATFTSSANNSWNPAFNFWKI